MGNQSSIDLGVVPDQYSIHKAMLVFFLTDYFAANAKAALEFELPEDSVSILKDVVSQSQRDPLWCVPQEACGHWEVTVSNVWSGPLSERARTA